MRQIRRCSNLTKHPTIFRSKFSALIKISCCFDLSPMLKMKRNLQFTECKVFSHLQSCPLSLDGISLAHLFKQICSLRAGVSVCFNTSFDDTGPPSNGYKKKTQSVKFKSCSLSSVARALENLALTRPLTY